MMKRCLRILALMLAILLLMTACAKTVTSSPGPVPIVTSAPAVTESPPEGEDVPPPSTVASSYDAFHALDREVFIRYITDDGYTFHQMLTDPAAFGLSSDSLKMSWGEFTEEDTEAYGLECAAYLSRLLEIPRSDLSERDQLSYDILQQYLEDASAENIYAYHFEPLTEYGGLHSSIPLALGLFKFRDEQDVKDYLLLLEDVPRYLDQVLAYEQRRAKLGLFMTEDALDAILAACKDILNARESFYLIGTFNSAVDAMASLDPSAAQSYKARSESVVKGPFMDAYQALYNGLKELRGSCRKPEGLCAAGETAKAYFEYAMQRDGDNRLSVEETLELLEAELLYMLSRYFERLSESPDAYDDTTLTNGDAKSDLDLLDSMSEQLLCKLPAHTVSIIAVPEEMENLLSGAAYVIPPIDNFSSNEILINPAYEDDAQLITLAHEGYPGHMFQYVYQRSLSDTGLMQRALHYGGYAEGWSQTAEYLIATTQTTYNSAYSELRFYDSMIQNVLLPAIVSIYVNYYGYSEDGVRLYLSGLNIGIEGYANQYYQLAVVLPLYFFNYATGYSQLSALLRDAEENIGETFDRGAFLRAYLDLGPGYFNLIQERMDVWIDENTPE